MSGYRLPYRSKFEVKVAADLGKRKVDFQYEKVSFDYVPKIRNYTPDFYLPESKIYIETKQTLFVPFSFDRIQEKICFWKLTFGKQTMGG